MVLNSEKRAELEEKLSELEAAIAQVREELKNDDEKRQHQSIDRLEDYLEETELNLISVKRFWRESVREIREFFKADKD